MRVVAAEGSRRVELVLREEVISELLAWFSLEFGYPSRTVAEALRAAAANVWEGQVGARRAQRESAAEAALLVRNEGYARVRQSLASRRRGLGQ